MIRHSLTDSTPGIGKGLIAAFLLRPNSCVVAGVRNPETQASDLLGLPKAEGSKLVIVQLDCASGTDALAAAETLQTQHGISHLDVVVANAAIAENYGPASTMRMEHLQNHMMVNTYSVLLLFQATRVLMEAAARIQGAAPPKFVLLGAPISTITDMDTYARAPLTAYAVSKLAANYLVRKFHFENRWLVAFVVDPGSVSLLPMQPSASFLVHLCCFVFF